LKYIVAQIQQQKPIKEHTHYSNIVIFNIQHSSSCWLDIQHTT